MDVTKEITYSEAYGKSTAWLGDEQNLNDIIA
jgi:hypothetical protein